jgi:glycosyltransferase involved in cell wall biosynthesis
MNPKPLITILMPCYNAERYLAEAVKSIICQSYQQLEILLIDDGSTDSTLNILEFYAKKDSRIRIIRNEANLKLIPTLNKGIDLARGEYIARMDADDVSLPERIEQQLEFIQQSGVDLVSSSVVVIDAYGKELEIIPPRGKSQITIEWLSMFINPMGHPSVMAKTDVFRAHKYLEGEQALHAEDYEIWARMLRAGVKMANSDVPTIKYRVNPHSVSIQNTDIQNRNFSRCVQLHIQSYTGFKLDDITAKIISNRYQPLEIQFSNIRRAFSFIRKMRTWFIAKKNINDKKLIAQIKAIGLEQKIDIIIQFYKRGNFFQKIHSGGLLLWLYFKGFRFIMTSDYLKSKFFSKYNRAIKAQYPHYKEGEIQTKRL